jgi:hypothetical protein
MEYNPSLQSQITETVNTAKNLFTMQLISVILKYTDVYYCARQRVRGLQCEPKHKISCRAQLAWAAGGT